MINSQSLINKICCVIDQGGLTALQTCQTTNALELLCQPVFSVANVAALPNAVIYNGRMVYVIDEAKYYYAVLGTWQTDFSSAKAVVVTTAWAWGFNGSGQLGDNTIVSKRSPVSVVGGFTDWCQVSAGNSLTAALKTDGTLWAWGYNGQGQLGDNTVANKSSPVSVVGGFCDWRQVSAGSRHLLGVRTGGTAWAWGCNGQGRLGDDTLTNRSSPVSVVGGFTDWCRVSAGGEHSLGVRQNGTAWAWGYNGQGRLGDNTTVSKRSPVSVVGGFTDWCQVLAGFTHSLAVRTDGTAWAWGCNAFGKLGDNTTVSKSSPVSVVGGFTDWCQVSTGGNNNVGLRQGGTAWAWGNNQYGQIGDDTTVSKSSPVSVVGGFTDWCQVSASSHSLGVRQNGTAWAWGNNSEGRLGDNTLTSRSSPVSVVGGFCDWCQVSAGTTHSLAIRAQTKGL
jgi:YD repeat-containing protein